MIFGLFKKHCPICGMAVEKGKSISRFDSFFCCEGHAEEYGKKQNSEPSHEGHGNCCH
jgi:hypothetical protein